jgi:hypothetical protein
MPTEDQTEKLVSMLRSREEIWIKKISPPESGGETYHFANNLNSFTSAEILLYLKNLNLVS